MSYRLELRGITKQYPGVRANDAVSLKVRPGEIHAVLGENGAGKSTLMKIIYGSVKPDEGSVFFNGQAVQVRNPQEARALGIAMVFQHFSLFDTLTVAENVWLGLDKSLTLAEVTGRISAKAAEYGLDIDPLRPVHTLSVGEMQRVEIIRALLTSPQLLILDEPTSVLTPQAVEKLFVVLRKLAAEGCSILYISHKLHEIRELCTACTVLRGGQVTGVCNPQNESNASLSRLMIGAEPPALIFADAAAQGAESRLTVYGVDEEQSGFGFGDGAVDGVAGVVQPRHVDHFQRGPRIVVAPLLDSPGERPHRFGLPLARHAVPIAQPLELAHRAGDAGRGRPADPVGRVDALDGARRVGVQAEVLVLGPGPEAVQVRLVPHFEEPAAQDAGELGQRFGAAGEEIDARARISRGGRHCLNSRGRGCPRL